MRIWTEAAKAAQRAAIQRWKPWAKSTGPRTAAGKAVSSRNAIKEGCLRAELQVINRAFRAHGRFLRALMRFTRMNLEKNSTERTIMQAALSRQGKAVTLALVHALLPGRPVHPVPELPVRLAA